MIQRRTVLILGAGSSVPYGLPTGRELLLQTAEMLRSGNQVILDLFRQLEIPTEAPGAFALLLLESMQPSVDAFLENQPKFLRVGKAAIAAALIPREIQRTIEQRDSHMNWYEYLFHQLGPNTTDFEQSHLTVVTFNYDRSLEYFLYNALARAFLMDHDGTLALYSRTPIIHLHGSLGAPHFISTEGRTYSTRLDLKSLSIASSGIRIPRAEEIDETPFHLAAEAINEAEVLCFLGFGYLPQNIRRLGIQRAEERSIFGSAFHLPKNDISRAQREIPGHVAFGTYEQESLAFMQNYPVFE